MSAETHAAVPIVPGEPVLPEARMHLVRPKEPVTGRIVETRLCTLGGRKAAGIVRHIAIDVSGTPLAGGFRVGQSFGVVPPGLDERGKPHALRLYSIASPTFGEDGEGRIVATTVKRTIAEREPQKPDDDPADHRLFLGVASNFLCDLKPGDEVKLTGPQGKRFLLPVDPSMHDYIFLATGTGIAPFRGMVKELLEGPAGPTSSRIHLVMGTPYRTDLLYDEYFRTLAAKHPNFHYHTAISREPGEGAPRGEYVDQYVARHGSVFRPLFRSPRTLVYVCGILGMQFGVYKEIAAEGAADGFLILSDELKAVDPRTWTTEQMKRQIRTTHRFMLEVY